MKGRSRHCLYVLPVSVPAIHSVEQQVATRESTSRHLAQVREMRHRAISNLVEPENGFKIKCRLPSGDILQRKFTKEDPVSYLVNWIGSSQDATENFTINIIIRIANFASNTLP
ncbi:uncharacterized protein [Apostichopus japonicus]|uniref:uncharacterized protein isoform X2 n=1 Tax=Stichopus japonicus TaxID=307972 RepID=UPI003AB8A6E6